MTKENDINHPDENEHQDAGKEEPKGVTQEELIDQLQAQIEYFERLPNHVQFSYITYADLAYFMLLVLNILKKGAK